MSLCPLCESNPDCKLRSTIGRNVVEANMVGIPAPNKPNVVYDSATRSGVVVQTRLFEPNQVLICESGSLEIKDGVVQGPGHSSENYLEI